MPKQRCIELHAPRQKCRHAILDKKLDKEKHIFFSCNGANKSIYYTINITSFQFVNQVLAFLLDSEAAIAYNAPITNASNYSLQKIDSIDSNSSAT